MSRQEMVIFTRTFELLSWLLPASEHFPRAYRHSFTLRMLGAAFDLREHLEAANLRGGKARAASLARADEALARLRVYLRLSARLKWLTAGQYQHVAGMTTEIGKLLGGWRKASTETGSPAAV